jgi:hypothetical protein
LIFGTLSPKSYCADILNPCSVNLDNILGDYTALERISIFSLEVFTISEIASTPLPTALPLFASGLGAMGLLGWRRKRTKTVATAAT